jgi:hypothetical protein
VDRASRTRRGSRRVTLRLELKCAAAAAAHVSGCRCASNCTAQHRVPVYFTRFVRKQLSLGTEAVKERFLSTTRCNVLVAPTVSTYLTWRGEGRLLL